MFKEIFQSPQVKWIVIISNKHGTSELPLDLKLKILENWEISKKSQNFIEL